MKKTGVFSFVFILLGASLLAACGAAPVSNTVPSGPAVAPQGSVATAIPQSTTANSAPASGANCTLLSKDEVGSVLGEAVLEVRDPIKDGSLCVYQSQTMILELSIIKKFGGLGDSVKYMQGTRTSGVGDAPLDVAGLGDEAFYHGVAIYRILLVRKGDTVYSFGVRTVTADQSLASPANAQALEKAIADLTLSRVP
jgi:hypothetical protein